MRCRKSFTLQLLQTTVRILGTIKGCFKTHLDTSVCVLCLLAASPGLYKYFVVSWVDAWGCLGGWLPGRLPLGLLSELISLYPRLGPTTRAEGPRPKTHKAEDMDIDSPAIVYLDATPP